MCRVGTQAAIEESALVERLRAGDEATFLELIDRLGPTMLRVAKMYVSSAAVAEEVVQDAWLGVLRGIDRFEGRASLRTWVLRIVTNIAKTRGKREGRSVPFATLSGAEDEPTWDPSAFTQHGEGSGGSWASMPVDWSGIPEDRLLAEESMSVVQGAIAGLPPMQAAVLRLRDVMGWSSQEVRNALELSETNQRVLLHRARAGVRRAVNDYLETGTSG